MFKNMKNYLTNGSNELIDEWLKKYPQTSNEAMKRLNDILSHSKELNV